MEMLRSTLSLLIPGPWFAVRLLRGAKDIKPKLLLLFYNVSTVISGNKFNIVMNFTTLNGTGTGEYQVLINTVDGIPIGQSFLTEPQPPGTYVIKWDVNARPDPDCDPTQQPCENWQPGNYSANVGM